MKIHNNNANVCKRKQVFTITTSALSLHVCPYFSFTMTCAYRHTLSPALDIIKTSPFKHTTDIMVGREILSLRWPSPWAC